MQNRFLVVDDDDMNLTRTRIILKNDYDVILVNSGMKALDTLKREKVDLVLLDIEMPNMDGFETFRQMKEFADGIPVIFLTAAGLEDDVVNAINLGAVNYLKKPFIPKELQRRVAQEFEK